MFFNSGVVIIAKPNFRGSNRLFSKNTKKSILETLVVIDFEKWENVVNCILELIILETRKSIFHPLN